MATLHQHGAGAVGGKALDPADQTPLLQYLRVQEAKKQQELQPQLSGQSWTVGHGGDDWNEWAEESDLPQELQNRHKTHSTYSFLMQPASSLGSSLEPMSPRHETVGWAGSQESSRNEYLSNGAMPKGVQARGLATTHHADSMAYNRTADTPLMQQPLRSMSAATQLSHHLSSSSSHTSLPPRSSTETSMPTTPTSVAHSQELAAAHIHEALRHMPGLSPDQKNVVSQLLSQISAQSSVASQDLAPGTALPGFPSNLRIITPVAGRCVTWDAASPVASRFAIGGRPLGSEPVSPASPDEHLRETPRSPGPEYSPQKRTPRVARYTAQPHASPRGLRERPSNPGPQFSPLKTVRSIRRVRSPRVQPGSARSTRTSRSPFALDGDSDDSDEYLQPVERSAQSLHVSLLRARKSSCKVPSSPGPEASPMKTVRSIRRVVDPSASAGVASPGRAARRDRHNPLSVSSPGPKGAPVSRVHSSMGLFGARQAVGSPMKGGRSTQGALPVQQSGRAMSRFSMIATSLDTGVQGLSQGGVPLDKLAELRAEFCESTQSGSEPTSPRAPPVHHLSPRPQAHPPPALTLDSPGQRVRQSGNFLHHLFGSPSPMASPASALRMSSTRSLLTAFDHAALLETVESDGWSPRVPSVQSPTSSTLVVPSTLQDPQEEEPRTPSDSDYYSGSDTALSPPQSPTASSPSHPYNRALLEEELQGMPGSPLGHSPGATFGSPTMVTAPAPPPVYPSPAEGYDPAAYAALESSLQHIVREHLTRHLPFDTRAAQPSEEGPATSASTGPSWAQTATEPLTSQDFSAGGVSPRTLHHLHPDAASAGGLSPSQQRAGSASSDEQLGDWGSVHGSGGSARHGEPPRRPSGQDDELMRASRSSLPGTACMLPLVPTSEPPSLQAWRGAPRCEVESPQRSPVRSLKTTFDDLVGPSVDTTPGDSAVRSLLTAINTAAVGDVAASTTPQAVASAAPTLVFPASAGDTQSAVLDLALDRAGPEGAGPVDTPTVVVTAPGTRAAEVPKKPSVEVPATLDTDSATLDAEGPGSAGSGLGPRGLNHLISMQLGSPNMPDELQTRVSQMQGASSTAALGGRKSGGVTPGEAAVGGGASVLGGPLEGVSSGDLAALLSATALEDAPSTGGVSATAMLTQMGHMKGELAGLQRLLARISATSSTLSQTLSTVVATKPASGGSSSAHSPHAVVSAASSLFSPLTTLNNSSATHTASQWDPVGLVTGSRAESDELQQVLFQAYQELLQTQQQQARIIDQMQMQLTVMVQLQQLQQLQDLEKQLPRLFEQLRAVSPAGDLPGLVMGMPVGGPGAATPAADVAGAAQGASATGNTSSGGLGSGADAPCARAPTLLQQGSAHDLLANSHAPSPAGTSPDVTATTQATHRAVTETDLESRPSGGSPSFKDKRPQPLVLQSSDQAAHTAVSMPHIALSPLRIPGAAKPPASPGRGLYDSPARTTRQSSYPMSPSQMTPQRRTFAATASPSGLRPPPEDFNLKQQLTMVTNSLFDDDDDDE